jgi:hypothetical protein
MTGPERIDGVDVHPPAKKRLFGLMAEFESPSALVRGAEAAEAAGYTILDAFSPFPIEEVAEIASRRRRSPVSKLVFAGGLAGAIVGFGFQVWTSVVDYPLNIGGRPLYSWPSFVIVTFELTILFAASAAVFGMLALNRLPMYYHPVFAVPGFERASRDGFFLMIESRDPKFSPDGTRAFLETLATTGVSDVED